MRFTDKVYKVVKRIPKGRVSTYREVAKALGCKAYRAVGNALNRNPYWPKVPCHRVVCSGGALGGFARGTEAKAKLLRREGIIIKGDKVTNFKKVVYKF